MTSILKAHFDAVESLLLARANISANAGHPIHIGSPREDFVREFLDAHLSERVAIGTGEIINAKSQAAEKRKQHDVVLFKRDQPRLDFGGGINAFLVESVVATIEVKSTLTELEFGKAFDAAVQLKQLERHTVLAAFAGYQAPAVQCYIVAYDGPAKMTTILGWLHAKIAASGKATPTLPADGSRVSIPSPSIDGVFVLGRGFVSFDNMPISLAHAVPNRSDVAWVYGDYTNGNMFMLWLLLTMTLGGASSSWLNPLPYLQDVSYPGLAWCG